MFLVVEKMGATAEDDELLLVFCRLGGGAVGEPPVLFAADILQKERRAKFAESGLKKKTRLTFDERTLYFTVNLHTTLLKHYI